MNDIIDISPPVRYSLAAQKAARLSLSKSQFFLVLGLSTSFDTTDNPLPPTLCTCHNPDVVLRVINLESKEESTFRSESARLLMELTGLRSPKKITAGANRVLSAIGSLFSHVHHTAYHDLSLFQLPKEMVSESHVSFETAEELDALTGGDIYYPDGIQVRLRSYVAIAETRLASIFYLLPFVLQNDELFDACSFFRSCCSEYSLMDGVVRDVLLDPKQEPQSEIERLALEQVVLQSLRTVEALIGEPGKNEKRFQDRLRAFGIKHDELVGFPGRKKLKLEDRVRWLQSLRDEVAAHGKRRRQKPLTMVEVMEAQHLADAVLGRALWWTAESQGRMGDERETAFLLQAMAGRYPFWVKDNKLFAPGWALDKKLFDGKCAADLARTSGGLARVWRYHERKFHAAFG